MLGPLDVRRVAATVEYDLGERTAGCGVALKHGPGLADHRLWRARLDTRPARDGTELTEVRKVEERRVTDDGVG